MKTKRKKELNKEDFQEKKAKDLMTAAQKEQCYGQTEIRAKITQATKK